ncbi:MAG: sigma-70 family RNA polymerase sigma factor [Pseudomonadota bacterium]
MTQEQLFERVCADHLPLIRGIARAYERDDFLAEQLEQDILLAVWRALAKLQDPNTLRAYVARIAQNRAATHVCVAARQPKGSGDEALERLADEAPSALEQVDADQRRSLLQRCLARLAPTLQRVAVLALEGLGNTEIANALGERANTVTVKLRRSRLQLTRCVESTGK